MAAPAALACNDAGIVAASTAIIFPAATLIYLVMKERDAQTEETSDTKAPELSPA